MLPALLFTFALLTAGCSKTYVYIDQEGGSPDQGSGGGSGLSLVSFHASVESRNVPAKSMSSLSKNVEAKLFAFDGTAGNADGAPVAAGSYNSVMPGMLSGVDGYKMYLTEGMYDFYAVSNNLSVPPVTFAAGQSEPLSNGVDYLWWSGLQQDITAQQFGIPIVFRHSASQVSFEVVAGEGVALDQLVSATITPTEPGTRMDLTTGLIPSAVGYDRGTAAMGINGTLAQYIMLPLKASEPMKAGFTVLINGESASRTYTVDVPVPDNVLIAGNSYRFKAVIRGSEITLPSVGVTDWVDVDETGKPLYPLP